MEIKEFKDLLDFWVLLVKMELMVPMVMMELKVTKEIKEK